MRSLIFYTHIVFIVFLFFQGCESKEASPTETLAQMYVDILIAEQSHMADKDSLQMALDHVYEKYGITKSDYENEIQNFKADEEKWDKFFELAEKYLDSLKTKGYPSGIRK